MNEHGFGPRSVCVNPATQPSWCSTGVPSVGGTVSFWQSLLPHRSVPHSASLHPASPVATEWRPGIRHPESGELRQHGDQRLRRQLCLHPRKVRDWLCFHGNTAVCPLSLSGEGSRSWVKETALCLCCQSVFPRQVFFFFFPWTVCPHTLLSSALAPVGQRSKG